MISSSKLSRTVASGLLKMLSPPLYNIIKNNKEITVAEYCQHQSRVYKLRMAFCSWWKDQKLDHIITPGFGCQPNLLNLIGDLSSCTIYTFIWNVLNMPAGALPVTISKKEE